MLVLVRRSNSRLNRKHDDGQELSPCAPAWLSPCLSLPRVLVTESGHWTRGGGRAELAAFWGGVGDRSERWWGQQAKRTYRRRSSSILIGLSASSKIRRLLFDLGFFSMQYSIRRFPIVIRSWHDFSGVGCLLESKMKSKLIRRIFELLLSFFDSSMFS